MKFLSLLEDAMNSIQPNPDIAQLLQTAQEVTKSDPNNPVANQIKAQVKKISQDTLKHLNIFHSKLQKMSSSFSTQAQPTSSSTSPQIPQPASSTATAPQ